jgi:hypothetical protein
MKRLFLFVLMLGFFNSGFSQQLLLEMPEETRYPEKRFGDNRAHMIRGLFGFGVAVPTAVFQDASQSIWRGGYVNFGMHYLARMGGFMALNIDLTADFQTVGFSPENNLKPEPMLLSQLERFSFSRMGLEFNPGFRFYLSKRRGEHQGVFLDLGLIGGLRMYHSWDFEGDFDQDHSGDVIFRNTDKLSFEVDGNQVFQFEKEATYTGVYARLGFHGLMIPVRYVQLSGNTFFFQTGLILSFK